MFKGEKTRVFWSGLIVFCYAAVMLFGYIWTFCLSGNEFFSWQNHVPLVFTIFVFLSIGFYMMFSGVVKNRGVRSESDGKAKRKLSARGLLILLFGIAFFVVGSALPAYLTNHIQVGHEENLSTQNSYTTFLEGGVTYKVDLVADAQSLASLYEISVNATCVETNETYSGWVEVQGQTVTEYFPFEASGLYSFNWGELIVYQITIFRSETFRLEPYKFFLVAAGLFAFIAGTVWTWRKSAFWVGMITFGFGLSLLFNNLWSGLGFGGGNTPYSFYGADYFAVSIVFLFAGLFLMKKGNQDRHFPH